LSPYLFLLVADTLQALIKKYAQEIKHPIDSSAHCAMLQYADDMPIVIKGELRGLTIHFAAATGLTINYNKTQ